MWWPFYSISNGFRQINQRLDKIIMSQQSIDNAVTVITGLLTDAAVNNQTILTDLTELQTKIANGTPVDTTALDNVVSQVSAVQSNLDNAVSNLNALATS
jgi:hypothetical protein